MGKKAKSAGTDTSVPLRFGDKGFVAAFKRAADAQAKETTKSPQAARDSLVRLGVLTAAGKLAKDYR